MYVLVRTHLKTQNNGYIIHLPCLLQYCSTHPITLEEEGSSSAEVQSKQNMLHSTHLYRVFIFAYALVYTLPFWRRMIQNNSNFSIWSWSRLDWNNCCSLWTRFKRPSINLIVYSFCHCISYPWAITDSDGPSPAMGHHPMGHRLTRWAIG